jgi:hypothetical protein
MSSLSQLRRDKAHKQITEDFNLAKELEVKEVWKKPKVSESDDACSSSKNIIQSINLSNEACMTPTPEVLDDAVIAQLLQAEFDLEFDEEIKRLEKTRNKGSNL